MNRREVLKAGVCTLSGVAASAAGMSMIGARPSHAADWPAKAIRVVVPYAPGRFSITNDCPTC